MRPNEVSRGLGKPEPFRFNWSRLGMVVFLMLWALLTLWLLSYYLESTGLLGEGAGAGPGGHMRMDFAESREMGLGMLSSAPANLADVALSQLFGLRQAAKNGSLADMATRLQAVRSGLQSSDNEAYRMTWTPVLACAAAGCDNRVYIQAAGMLAARQPRLAGNVMAIEAAYWYEAREAGDEAAAATAVAKLDRLVRTYGNTSLAARWTRLQNCGGDCPIFEELLLDFMGEAARI